MDTAKAAEELLSITKRTGHFFKDCCGYRCLKKRMKQNIELSPTYPILIRSLLC